MTRALLLCLLAEITLVGCGATQSTDENGAVSVSNGGGAGSVQLVTLSDGTRCAVLIGYYKGGIDCDWGRP